MIEARTAIASASLGPAELSTLLQAFDEAWQQVAYGFTAPLEAKAARLKMANAVLAQAKHGVIFGRLKQAALDVIADRLRTPHEVELDRALDLINEAKERVAVQRDRVNEQIRLGQNSELSRQLLRSFELTLGLMVRHSKIIEKEVKREEAALDLA